MRINAFTIWELIITVMILIFIVAFVNEIYLKSAKGIEMEINDTELLNELIITDMKLSKMFFSCDSVALENEILLFYSQNEVTSLYYKDNHLHINDILINNVRIEDIAYIPFDQSESLIKGMNVVYHTRKSNYSVKYSKIYPSLVYYKSSFK